jgi:hypothetical protein
MAVLNANQEGTVAKSVANCFRISRKTGQNRELLPFEKLDDNDQENAYSIGYKS